MPVAAKIKISMKRNLNVGIEDIICASLYLSYFSNALSGMDRSVIIMNIMIVMVPQKKAINIASFRRISC
jgi:hypothetical protein